ncbi:MAG: nucleotidyl transferase AbiEii/AbiGii toxin family protein [Legionella sp.]|nr:nucleotidyl transferase AbiEii/AbiGii toxin family protein [Legionella sp.]
MSSYINQAFLSILSASEEDKRGLFIATANRLGVPIQNIEKDFWVCLVLDVLFNGQEKSSPRLLFKGGTSLSKAYSLISRFSEDIDITIFREDLGLDMPFVELEALSGKQQRKYFEKIKRASHEYICNRLKPHLQSIFDALFREIRSNTQTPTIEIDPNDASCQTLLLRYPSLSHSQSYVLPTVKIEAGAKSALDPHQYMTIYPYINEDLPDLDLKVNNVITIEPARTFWDKIIILHGIRRWFDINGILRQNGHRYSRHYYDVYQLLKSDVFNHMMSKQDLAIDCTKHAQMFFNSSSLDLQAAYKGTFSITPNQKMIQALKKDYQAMSGMIFATVPHFDDIIDVISTFENDLLNQG